MLFLLLILLGIIASGLFIYYTQYLNNGIIYWSIPIVIIAMILLVALFVIFILYIVTIFIRTDKKLDKPSKFCRVVTKMFAEFLTGLFRIKFVKKGFEKLPENRNCLFIGNHQSNIDPFANVWVFRKKDVAFIMKDAIMKVPVLGRWLYGSGFLPLDRNNDRKAVEIINTAANRIVTGDQSIFVYPEGTRSKGPNMNKFRNGVFKIALKAKCPIVVTIMDNTYRIKLRFPFRRTKVLVEVVGVIEYDVIKEMNTNQIGDMIHNMMTSRLEERREELDFLALKDNK